MVNEVEVSDKLSYWWELSYASFLTLPRVLMEAMPTEWQDKMADLLNEYNAAFPNQPDIGTQVRITDRGGRLIPCPDWLKNYRHPDVKEIEKLRSFPNTKIKKEGKLHGTTRG